MFRPNAGTYYIDVEGNLLYASDHLYQKGSDLTVSAAWASLRKCWKAFKIAKNKDDEVIKSLYAKRIQKLAGLLSIPINEFSDVDLSIEVTDEVPYWPK